MLTLDIIQDVAYMRVAVAYKIHTVAGHDEYLFKVLSENDNAMKHKLPPEALYIIRFTVVTRGTLTAHTPIWKTALTKR